jgi:ABC-type transport system substrate-binding protein
MNQTSSLSSRWKRAMALAASFAMVAAACSSASSPGVTQPPAGSAAPGASQAPGASPSAAAFSGTQDAVLGGSAIVGLPAGGIDHLEPTLWYFATSWQIAFATCTPLVSFGDKAGQDGAQVIAGLADLPTLSSDGTTYTFTLRPGITFSDGKPITAADIAYTWQRMLSPKLASPADGFFADIVGAADYSAGKTTDIPGITTSGDTISFKLTRPIGAFLYRMTMPFTCPVPVGTALDPIEDGSILGTGPYVVKSYTPNRELVLVKNPHYNATALGARGKLDTITIQMNVDPAQAGLQIRAGQMATFMDKLAPADATQALNDPTLAGRVFAGTLPSTTYLWLNATVAPFDNVKVRQAVNYALDRQAVLRIWGGPSQGAVTSQVLPPTMPGWQQASTYPPAGDVAKAKSLLQESGVSLPINTVLRVRSDAAGYVEIAQAVQAQLKAVGINVDIQSAPDSVNYGIISATANNVPMGINTWTQDYPDPDDFFGPLLDGNRITPKSNNNFGSFNVPAVNAEIEAMDGVSDSTRAAKWNQIDAEVIGLYSAWAPLLNASQVALLAKGICGYVFHPVYVLDLTTLGHCQ